ncbi:MAG: helix-turn-helix domain-containing protein [Acidimicrobiales bacterium]
MIPPHAHAEVALLRWPADAARRDELASRGLPRVLLVVDGQRPPLLAHDEDWVRSPVDERDLWARMQRLSHRQQVRSRRPVLVDDVVLHHAGATVIVTEGEGTLLRLLLDHFGRLVTWVDLQRALWPDGRGTSRAATSRVSRLRVRVEPIGLAIHTVRRRGVVLDADEPPTAGWASTRTEEQPSPI